MSERPPFVGPFRVGHNSSPIDLKFWVVDDDGAQVSRALSQRSSAVWLCDRLNAAPPQSPRVDVDAACRMMWGDWWWWQKEADDTRPGYAHAEKRDKMRDLDRARMARFLAAINATQERKP